MTDKVGHFGAVDHIFRRQAGNVRARSSDEAAFDHGCPETLTRAGPGSNLTARTTAEDKDIEAFDFTHDVSPVTFVRTGQLAASIDLTSAAADAPSSESP